jgi:hypothetical protein
MALAHAIWSVDDGATLCTMAMVEADDDRAVLTANRT